MSREPAERQDTGRGARAPAATRRALRGRLRLRTRMIVAFGAISFAVSSLSAGATWYLAADYMVSQRERAAIRQASADASFVESSIRSGSDGLEDLVTGLSATSNSAVFLQWDDGWMKGGTELQADVLPTAVLHAVENGQAVSERTYLHGAPVLVVGMPISSVDTTYVEVFSLRELDRTLKFLSATLASTAFASVVLSALLGLRAATRGLRPLAELNAAVREVADGGREIRLPTSPDPDLAALAAAFGETASKLRQRVERDARFASDVSHELRSPLTTMVNAAAVLDRRRDDMPASARDALSLLTDELHRFDRLVRDLLEISREDQADEEAWEPVDLVELVRHALPTVAVSMDPGSAREAFRVWGDRRRLERVLANVVDNADRHGKGLVHFALSADAQTVRIEVDDAGPGVPEADRERVFERFARGAGVSRGSYDGGSGLGLALAADHVRRHRGRIWVEDRPGGGARFVIELPATSA